MDGMKQCPNCDCMDVPIYAEICPFCGHPFELRQKERPTEWNSADGYSRLRTLEQFASYLEESGSDVVFEDGFVKQLKKVIIQEMNAAHVFEEQMEVRSKAEKVTFLIEQSSPEDSRQCLLFVDYLLWSGFDISQFSLQDAQKYRKCSLDELARSGFNGKECKNACIVKDLFGIATEFPLTTGQIYEIFFTNEIFDDMAIKKVLQNILREVQMKDCTYKCRDEMELSILCHYDLENDRMETAEWIRKVLNAGCDRLFMPEMLPKVVNKSRILSDCRLKMYIAKSLDAELKNKKWKTGGEEDKRVKRAMKLLLACLLE